MGRELKFTLAFRCLACQRCGGERIAKQVCPDCGARPSPHETQPDLERRRRLVREFKDRRRAVEPDGYPTDVEASFGRAWDGVVRALTAAATRDRSAEPLVIAFERLDQLLADVSVLRPRPHLNEGARIRAVIEGIEQGLAKYVEALAASGIMEAQRIEAEGQATIDAAWAQLEANDRHDRLGADAEGSDLFERLGTDHASIAGTDDLRVMQQQLGHAIGLPGSNTGLHAAIDVIDIYAATSLDRLRLRQLSDYTEAVLAAADSVLNDPHWRRDMITTGLLLSSRVAAWSHASEADEAPVAEVAAALDLVTTVRERGLRQTVAPLLAAGGHGSYQDLSKRSTGAVLKKGQEALPGLALEELDRGLRHAGAHGGFRVEGGQIVFDHGRTRIDQVAFVDSVLAFVECHSGIMRGVYMAMARRNIDMPRTRDLSFRDRVETIRYFLGTLGVRDVGVERHGEHVAIAAAGSRHNWGAAVAGLTPLVPEEVSTLSIELDTGTETVVGRAELGPYRRLDLGTEPLGTDVGLFKFLQACAGTRFEGRCILGPEVWMKAATDVSADRGQGDFLADRVRRVLRVRTLAAHTDIPTLGINALLKRLRC